MKNKLNKLLAIFLCIVMAAGSLAAVVEGELPQPQETALIESPAPETPAPETPAVPQESAAVEDGTEPPAEPTTEPPVEPPTEPESPACSCPDVEGVDKTAPDYVHEKACPLYVKLCSCEATEEEKAAEGFTHSEGCDFYVAPVNPWLELYEKLMAAQTLEEFDALVRDMDDEAEAAFLDALTAEQLDALEAHIAELVELAPPEQTVSFTSAGPFMEAVNVASAAVKMRTMLKAAPQSQPQEDNGLVLNKTAVRNDDDDDYTISLESYTTGNVVATTTPVDIVLVLDQSGSMTGIFGGLITGTTRQNAMKNAVNSFIDSVNKKYNAATSDHRIAIVTFGTGASVLNDRGWTPVDADGKDNLQGDITGLPNRPSGATNVAAGMSLAETLMSTDGYNYTGNNQKRQKVVVVFTDGVPTTGSEFDTGVADSALLSAKALKDSKVTVYSIGIFNGADPNVLHGGNNGAVGASWTSWSDSAAGNRFLNYLSSNCKEASAIGLSITDAGWDGDSYTITSNAAKTKDGYYLTASDETGLNNIFANLSANIGKPTIELGSTVVVKDVVSPYFDMPENVSDIKVYTAAKTADGWAERVESALVPTVNESTVSVTGFDYDANCVTETPDDNGSYGSKLIVEFTVKAKSDFLGGNNVPTNLASSALYEKEGDKEPFEAFPLPTVDVPIKFNYNTANQSIYLGQAANLESLLAPTITPNGVNNAYVNIKYDICDPDGNVLGTLSIPAGSANGTWSWPVETGTPYLMETLTFKVKCTVSPSSSKSGDVTAYSDTKDATVTVNTCTLTITKTGASSLDANQGFIFNVTGANLANCRYADEINLNVSVNGKDGEDGKDGNGSVTIAGLPVGTYTVTEDGWSWRYTAAGLSPVVLDKDNPTDTLTVANTRTNQYLLDGSAYAQNIGTAPAVSN